MFDSGNFWDKIPFWFLKIYLSQVTLPNIWLLVLILLGVKYLIKKGDKKLGTNDGIKGGSG